MRWRLLLAATGLVPLITYFGVAAVVAAVAVTAQGGRDSLAAALVAALPGWLAAFQVPLSIQHAPLSALPLLPTLGVVTLIAKAAAHVVRRSRARRPEQGLWVILVMAFGHALVGTALALLAARLPGPVDVSPGGAFACCGLIAAVGATLGVVHRCGLLYLLWDRVPGPLWWGMSCGVRTCGAIAGAGGLVLAGALCLSAPELLARSSQAGSPGAVFGGIVLCALYLPDAVLAAWSYVAGTGLSLGQFAFGSLGDVPQVQVLPTLPLFGLLPDASLSPWWSLLVVVPVLVGVHLGWMCRGSHEQPRLRLAVVATAAAVASALVMVAGLVVGGDAGGGSLDPVSVHPLPLAVATWAWLAVPAGVTAWFGGPRPPRARPMVGEVRPDEFDEQREPEDPVDEQDAAELRETADLEEPDEQDDVEELEDLGELADELDDDVEELLDEDRDELVHGDGPDDQDDPDNSGDFDDDADDADAPDHDAPDGSAPRSARSTAGDE